MRCAHSGLTPVHLKVFKLLYDEDICEEDAFLRWADDGNTKTIADIRNVVAPFLTWLREADETESEED